MAINTGHVRIWLQTSPSPHSYSGSIPADTLHLDPYFYRSESRLSSWWPYWVLLSDGVCGPYDL